MQEGSTATLSTCGASHGMHKVCLSGLANVVRLASRQTVTAFQPMTAAICQICICCRLATPILCYRVGSILVHRPFCQFPVTADSWNLMRQCDASPKWWAPRSVLLDVTSFTDLAGPTNTATHVSFIYYDTVIFLVHRSLFLSPPWRWLSRRMTQGSPTTPMTL